MIASLPEIRRGLDGALAILRRDPAAMGRFDLSFDGFVRSFSALPLAWPAYVLLVLRRLRAEDATLSLPLLLLVETGGYVLAWLAFLLAAALVLKLLGETRRFVPLAVANNWAAVVQIHFLLAATVLAGALDPGAGAGLETAAVLAALVYQWLVVKTALDAPGSVAVGFLLLDLLITALVGTGTDRLIAALA